MDVCIVKDGVVLCEGVSVESAEWRAMTAKGTTAIDYALLDIFDKDRDGDLDEIDAAVEPTCARCMDVYRKMNAEQEEENVVETFEREYRVVPVTMNGNTVYAMDYTVQCPKIDCEHGGSFWRSESRRAFVSTYPTVEEAEKEIERDKKDRERYGDDD